MSKHRSGMYGPNGYEGELEFFPALVNDERVLVDFGTPIVLLLLDPKQARYLAKKLVERASLAERESEFRRRWRRALAEPEEKSVEGEG